MKKDLAPPRNPMQESALESHIMKLFPLVMVILFAALAGHAQPFLTPSFPPPFRAPMLPPAPGAAAKDPVNYLIHVEWTESSGAPKTLEVLTTEGNFEYDGFLNAVKINSNDVPVTIKFSGSITALDDKRGRLQLFLGRTVPYVTGTYGNGPGAASSYSQQSVGLQSTFIVRFGKSIEINSDAGGNISVLVTRLAD